LTSFSSACTGGGVSAQSRVETQPEGRRAGCPTSVPISRPVLGNREDSGAGYFDYFNGPGVGELHDRGARVRF
jgi:hypothetical protein